MNPTRSAVSRRTFSGLFTLIAAAAFVRGATNQFQQVIVDFDGDGDLDIVSIAWRNFQFLHVWRNDAVRSPRTGGK